MSQHQGKKDGLLPLRTFVILSSAFVITVTALINPLFGAGTAVFLASIAALNKLIE
jgi:hypothetical protein